MWPFTYNIQLAVTTFCPAYVIYILVFCGHLDCDCYNHVLICVYTQLRRAGDSELLRRFTEENVIVLHSRASGNTIRFKGGEVEGTGGHGSRGKNVTSISVLCSINRTC